MKSRKVLADFLFVLLALSAATSAVLSFTYGVHFSTVISRSMEPIIQAGDTVISRSISRLDLKVGDVAVLPHPDDTNLIYAHRITSVTQGKSETLITTKGDANPDPDSWSTKIYSNYIPKVVAVLPSSLLDKGPISRKGALSILLVLGLALVLRGAFFYLPGM